MEVPRDKDGLNGADQNNETVPLRTDASTENTHLLRIFTDFVGITVSKKERERVDDGATGFRRIGVLIFPTKIQPVGKRSGLVSRIDAFVDRGRSRRARMESFVDIPRFIPAVLGSSTLAFFTGAYMEAVWWHSVPVAEDFIVAGIASLFAWGIVFDLSNRPLSKEEIEKLKSHLGMIEEQARAKANRFSNSKEP